MKTTYLLFTDWDGRKMLLGSPKRKRETSLPNSSHWKLGCRFRVCIVLSPLESWDAAGLLRGKRAEMKAALLIRVACSSLPSQHYPLRRREAGPGLPKVCTRKEEISQRWKGMHWSVVVAQNKLLYSSQQITLFCNHSPLLPTHTDAFLSSPSIPPWTSSTFAWCSIL